MTGAFEAPSRQSAQRRWHTVHVRSSCWHHWHHSGFPVEEDVTPVIGSNKFNCRKQQEICEMWKNQTKNCCLIVVHCSYQFGMCGQK